MRWWVDELLARDSDCKLSLDPTVEQMARVVGIAQNIVGFEAHWRSHRSAVGSGGCFHQPLALAISLHVGSVLSLTPVFYETMDDGSLPKTDYRS